MRPHPAFALVLLLGVSMMVACGAEHAPTTPASPRSASSLFDELSPAADDAGDVPDLTDRLRGSGALSMTSVQAGRRAVVTVMAGNPFEAPIREFKIIIIDNPTTRVFGPVPLLVGGHLVFSTIVSTRVTLDQVRVTGSLP